MEELVSAEDFLNYFGIEYDPSVVHVNRLHILQRFHNYLGKATLPELEEGRRVVYTTLLKQAYQDFVKSDALTEKVFKVFHMHEPQVKFVPISSITVNKEGMLPKSNSASVFSPSPASGRRAGDEGLCVQSSSATARRPSPG